MPRLDIWLVETGHFSSRQAAKRAIKDGLVLVNGGKCKPSTNVSEKDTIELLSTEADVPKGYQKLKKLDELLDCKLVGRKCVALDIGSSAGGFLLYLAEKGANVVGIEISERFSEALQVIVEQQPTVSVVFADAFTMDPTDITNEGELDLLLVDVTTDPEGTLKLIEKFTPLLKSKGRILAAFKSNPKSDTSTSFKEVISQLGYDQVKEIILEESRQEIHITAIYM